MVFGEHLSRCWKQITQFHAGGARPAAPTPAPSAPVGYSAPDPEAFTLPEGDKLVRDERGVRLARPDEQAD